MFAFILSASLVVAQAATLQQKVAAIEASVYKNKQTTTINGQSKSLTIQDVNMNYENLSQ